MSGATRRDAKRAERRAGLLLLVWFGLALGSVSVLLGLGASDVVVALVIATLMAALAVPIAMTMWRDSREAGAVLVDAGRPASHVFTIVFLAMIGLGVGKSIIAALLGTPVDVASYGAIVGWGLIAIPLVMRARDGRVQVREHGLWTGGFLARWDDILQCRWRTAPPGALIVVRRARLLPKVIQLDFRPSQRAEVDAIVRRMVRTCPTCGYDLHGHADDTPRCPECGEQA